VVQTVQVAAAGAGRGWSSASRHPGR
jgi:hypothetical protein